MQEVIATPGAEEGGTGAENDFRYAAFISYRHVEPDRKWARWLHRELETYRVPGRLRKERGLPVRVGRVFRDEEELSASPSLSDDINAALERSRFLIVVCSPRTPASEWVNREVERFREMGRHDRILAMLIEGEPGEAFPRALREIRRTLVDSRGLAREEMAEVEPLAADARPGYGHGGGHARRLGRLRLLSAMLGLRFDDLRQRETERRMRRLALLGAVLGVLLLVMAGLTAFAVRERNEAYRQRAQADTQRAEALAQRERAVRGEQEAEQRRAQAEEATATLGQLLADVGDRLTPREYNVKERAADVLQQALNPSNVSAWLGLLTVYQKLGDVDSDRGNRAKALVWYDKATSLARVLENNWRVAGRSPAEEVRARVSRAVTSVSEKQGDLLTGSGDAAGAASRYEVAMGELGPGVGAGDGTMLADLLRTARKAGDAYRAAARYRSASQAYGYGSNQAGEFLKAHPPAPTEAATFGALAADLKARAVACDRAEAAEAASGKGRNDPPGAESRSEPGPPRPAPAAVGRPVQFSLERGEEGVDRMEWVRESPTTWRYTQSGSGAATMEALCRATAGGLSGTALGPGPASVFIPDGGLPMLIRQPDWEDLGPIQVSRLESQRAPAPATTRSSAPAVARSAAERPGTPATQRVGAVVDGRTAVRFTQDFDPLLGEHGRCEWARVDATTWRERRPDGRVIDYVTTGQTTVSGHKGTVVRRSEDGLRDVFIPDDDTHLFDRYPGWVVAGPVSVSEWSRGTPAPPQASTRPAGQVPVTPPVGFGADRRPTDFVFFAAEIQPVFQRSCAKCHDGGKPEGAYRLDSRALAFTPGDSGKPPVVPGDRNGSNLLRLIRSGRMPPGAQAPVPTREDIELIGRWIDEGAPWPDEDDPAGGRGVPPPEFWYAYNFPPQPGARCWRRTDDGHWEERYPDGNVTSFRIVGDSADEKAVGTVVRRLPDSGFEVLVPPLAEGRPLKFRQSPREGWGTLGPIHLGTPPATQPARPASQP